MNLSRINLNLLVILDVLLQEKHVTKASLRLNLTQSTVSIALKQLREIFSDELLVREKNRMFLTIKAQELAPKIRNILNQLQGQVFSEVDFDPASSERTFEIAVNDYLECIIMTELMPEIIKVAPNINIITKHADYISDTLFEQESAIDLAVGISTITNTNKNIQLQELYCETLVCVGTETNEILKQPLTLDTYLEAKHLDLVADKKDINTNIDYILQQMGYFRSVAVTVNHLATAMYLLSNSHLIATLPLALVNKARHLLNVRYQPLPFNLPKIQVFQAWHYQFNQDSGHIWLRNIIQKTINSVVQN